MNGIFIGYFYWHFTVAPFEILRIMKDYLDAYWHRFLITQHLRTLFSPWHRQNPSELGDRKKAFADKIIDLIIDLYIRLIAAVARTVVIASGLLCQIILLVIFMLLFVFWIVWPIAGVYLISKGIIDITL